MPKKWNGKARCKPDKERQLRAVERELRRCWDRVVAKGWTQRFRQGRYRGTLKEWLSEQANSAGHQLGRRISFEKVWEDWERMNPEAVDEVTLEGFKQTLGKFVVCPVDKFPQEGMVL